MMSLPEKFEVSMRQQLGDAFPSFLDSLHEPPTPSIRLHPLKKATINAASDVPWTQYGRYLDSRPTFTLDPHFHAGSYYVQEASSMFLEQALRQTTDLQQPLRVLDLCAAPGGKSTHILSLINRDSLLVSNETIRARANILSENIQKWGYPNAIVTNNDPADFKKLQGYFDIIVVDAPCSGEGLFRKEPDAMHEWSPEHVQLCASRQKRIVSDAWDALKENGVFIYCTCTYNTAENEQNLRWLQEHHGVQFLQIRTEPGWNVQEVQDGNVIGYRFFPHKIRGEGFFLAAMRKAEDTPTVLVKTKKNLAGPSAQVLTKLEGWFHEGVDNRYFQFDDLLFCLPTSLAQEFNFLLQSLRIVYAGTNVTTVKREKLVPEHSLALSVEMRQDAFQVFEISYEQALAYLRKETIHLDTSTPGFALLTHHQMPLGWVNVLSNRINNLYPQQWRIRMNHG